MGRSSCLTTVSQQKYLAGWQTHIQLHQELFPECVAELGLAVQQEKVLLLYACKPHHGAKPTTGVPEASSQSPFGLDCSISCICDKAAAVRVDAAGMQDWAQLSPEQRMGVITMLARLVGEANAARSLLAEEETARREDKKSLDELRKQARRSFTIRFSLLDLFMLSLVDLLLCSSKAGSDKSRGTKAAESVNL